MPVMRTLALAIAVVATACGGRPVASAATALPSPAAVSSPTATPSHSPSPDAAPQSAGTVPEAGVLYVWGADDQIYRYDGTTGALTPVWGKSSLVREMAYGPYVLGRHGGIELLQWDGSITEVCGRGLFADVSTRGECAFRGDGADNALYVDSPAGARMLLPADWGATQFAWDGNGLQLAITRFEPRPEPARGHATLWVMDVRHGTLRKVFDSTSATSFISRIQWSFESHKIAFIEQQNTSASAGADGAGVHLWVVDLDSLERTDLGEVLGKAAWIRWAPHERLAYVAGFGRETWGNKEIVIVEADGTKHVVAGALTSSPAPNDRSALAPAWQPVYDGAKLAWIEGPALSIEASPDYFRGIGPSAQRVAVLDGASRVTCPDRVTEGVRWSADGKSVLLLCRVPAVEYHALEVWWAPVGGTPKPLVRNLGDLGFGYYGMQPSLFEITAWSLADR